MYKNNLSYKKYFIKIGYVLKKLNFNYLYYIPSIYKKDLRRDKISIIKINFNFLVSLFRKNYLIDDPNHLVNSRICFISHYVGNRILDKNYDFYYGKLFKKLQIEEKFFVLLINHTNENLYDVQKKFKNSKIKRAYVNNDFSLFRDSLSILKIINKYINFLIKKKLNIKNLKF